MRGGSMVAGTGWGTSLLDLQRLVRRRVMRAKDFNIPAMKYGKYLGLTLRLPR